MEKTHELLANRKVFRANFESIASMNEEESDKTTIKTENRNRNEENRRQIIDFDGIECGVDEVVEHCVLTSAIEHQQLAERG